VNRNKTSIALDLATPEDVARARALAAESDIVVENFRPGTLERLGLGYDDLRRENPAIIYCSITGFGRGKGAALPGYDLLVQALGGLFATIGILAALRHRDRTGEGQRVDIDLLSSLLAALVNQAAGFTIAGVITGQSTNVGPG
jgi:crotonobetainyl-CoA:carnitine CoA-transferase CaiB-like acyl-CoA transferase